METLGALTPLAARDHLVGIAPLVIGLIVVGMLIAAVAYGKRLRSRGDMRPSSPQPRRRHRSPGDDQARIGPAEMPHDGRRRMPYEVSDQGITGDDTGVEEKPPRWHEGGSGSFGSGGFGSRS